MFASVADGIRCGRRSTANLISIPSDFSRIPQATHDILSLAQDLGYNEEAMFAIALALDEALTNAIEHGNGCDPTKQVHVRYRVTDARAYISVEDEGVGFDPDLVPYPTLNENPRFRWSRGITLMRACMDEVAFNRQGNEVRMIKVNDRRVAAENRLDRGFMMN